MSRHARRVAPVASGGLLASIALALLVSAPAEAATTPPIPVGTPPVAVITAPNRAYAGIPITLSGSASTASDSAISEWEWDLNGDGRFERDSTSTPWTSKSFSAGPHTVSLRVRSEAGLVSTAMKSFTVRRPSAGVVSPDAPIAVTADADGTTIVVAWQEPLGAPVLTYRVTNMEDQDADPVYVPATDRLRVSFTALVPGTYRIRVAGINSEGSGPSSEAQASVFPKGGASPTATPPASAIPTPPSTTAPGTTITPSTTTAASTGGGNDRSAIGIALIAAGVLLVLTAGGAAVVGYRNRNA